MKPLLAEYDLTVISTQINPSSLREREGTMWRYHELLPVRDASSVMTLGEGWTPIIRAKRLGDQLGLSDLFIKDEGLNPTGSFKARGLSMAVSKAHELGVEEVCIPSAGNAGGALAAYAAKAGMRAHVFVPRDTPRVNIQEVSLYGAQIHLVDGVISDAARKMMDEKKGTQWFDLSTMKEPYRLEGKKTMGYEIAEQFEWNLPDVIIYPAGGGTGLIGMWKAFSEMEELGWIGPRRPRMVVVQASGCAPIVKAFQERQNQSEFWSGASTVASGLRVPKAFADSLILDTLYKSGGSAVDVPDAMLLEDMRRVANIEGLFLCPEGAATVSAARMLQEQGWIRGDEKVVLFNTGSGYKYVELFT